MNGTLTARFEALLRDRDSLEAQLGSALAALAQRTRERDALRTACQSAERAMSGWPNWSADALGQVTRELRTALRAEAQP